GVERLGEARVHDRRLEPVPRERLGGLERGAHGMPVGEDREVRSLAQGLGDADRHLGERRVQRDARAGAAPAPGPAPTAAGRRVGNSLNRACIPVPPGMAAVMATARGSALRISRTVSAKTAVYCGPAGFAAPVAETPCHFTLSSSAGP